MAVRNLTECAGDLHQTTVKTTTNRADSRESNRIPRTSDQLELMLSALFISLIIIVPALISLRPDSKGRLISHTPYNNRNNDATGAREDHLG